MSAALVVLCGAALLLAASVVSLGVAAAAPARPLLDRLEPTWRVRAWTLVALAPLAVGLAAVAISLGPSLGLGADHCGVHGDHHPHLCIAHAHLHDGLALIVLAALAGLRFLVAAARVGLGAWRTSRLARTLGTISDMDMVDVPQAFAATLGWWRPRAFVSMAVPEAIRPAVIAHEQAHVRHRDPLVRALIDLALAFHLPGVADGVRRALHRAQEARADAEAAAATGDRDAIAGALIAMARLAGAPPRGQAAAFDGDVAARVADLLDDRPRWQVPAPAVAVVIALLAAAMFVEADAIHHALESALGFFGG